MIDSGIKKQDVSTLMSELNLIKVQSFPDSNPFPVMRVLDDGTVLYSNQAARDVFASFTVGELWTVPEAWMPCVEQALQAGQATMEVRTQQKSYDLVMIGIEPLCVNIYAHDVTARDKALQALRRVNRKKSNDISLRTRELAAVNLRLMDENTRYRSLQNKLETMVMTDELTGLSNRRYFNQALQQAMLRCQRSETRLAVMFIDLNTFEQVNDQFGHDVGDAVLCEVGMRLKQCLRDLDESARLSGDEFAVVLEGFSQQDDVCIPARRIVQALAEPFYINKHCLHVGCSVGISIYSSAANTLDALMHQSDCAMYKAKADGGGYRFYAADMEGESDA